MNVHKRLPAVIGAFCILIGPTVAVAQDTGTGPRDFKPKFKPHYRYTELENGLENNALTLFGLYAAADAVAVWEQ